MMVCVARRSRLYENHVLCDRPGGTSELTGTRPTLSLMLTPQDALKGE